MLTSKGSHAEHLHGGRQQFRRCLSNRALKKALPRQNCNAVQGGAGRAAAVVNQDGPLRPLHNLGSCSDRQAHWEPELPCLSLNLAISGTPSLAPRPCHHLEHHEMGTASQYRAPRIPGSPSSTPSDALLAAPKHAGIKTAQADLRTCGPVSSSGVSALLPLRK